MGRTQPSPSSGKTEPILGIEDLIIEEYTFQTQRLHGL
jgi:hypothetical protein